MTFFFPKVADEIDWNKEYDLSVTKIKQPFFPVHSSGYVHCVVKVGGLFLCVNRYNKKIGSEDIILAEYPYDDRWKYHFSNSKWNQNHIHEFITERLDLPNPEFPYPQLQNLPR